MQRLFEKHTSDMNRVGFTEPAIRLAKLNYPTLDMIILLGTLPASSKFRTAGVIQGSTLKKLPGYLSYSAASNSAAAFAAHNALL